MTKLDFAVLDIRPERYAATPNLLFRLLITESTDEPIHAMALRCQVRIEPHRRGYADAEKAGLAELFGTAERWGETLKPFLWTQTSTMVPGFTGSVEVELPLPCTYDFEVTAAKYLHALGEGGEVPLVLLFSGTVFSRGASGFCVEQIPWHLEAEYRMPVQVWRGLMDEYFANSAWIRIQRDSLDRLVRFKADRALTSWEQVLDELLPAERVLAETEAQP